MSNSDVIVLITLVFIALTYIEQHNNNKKK